MGNSYKIPFELGTWAGLATFAYFLIVWFTPFSPLGMLRYGSFWIPILFIFLAVYRQMKANGVLGLTFGNAFMVGMFTVLVLGALKAVLVYIMMEHIDPSIIPHAYEERISFLQRAREVSLTPEMIDKQILFESAEKDKITTLELAYREVNINFLGGIPISLLAAIIFNRKPQNA